MKVSLYLEDEVWKKFKRDVLRRTGEPRSLSAEVQELIQNASIEDSIRKGFGQMKVDVKPISSSKITQVKPSVSTSSAATLRKMRERRLVNSTKDLP
jgi:hypothetical protein